MPPPMIPEQRHQEILRMLRVVGVLGTRELTDAMDVSHMTIRRDIAALEAAGSVVRVQGGVRLVTRPGEKLPQEPPCDRMAPRAFELHGERAIAAAAAARVRDGSVIFLDAGTTCKAVIPHLLGRVGLTVVTNDFTTAVALSPHHHIDVIHTGGLVDPSQRWVHGPLAVATVEQLAIDVYLISGDNWGVVDGVTVPQADTALLKKAVMAVSHHSVLLAHSANFGAFERYRVSQLRALDVIITDDRLPSDAAAQIRELGAQLERVPIDDLAP